MIPTFFGIVVICFALTRLLPGGPVEEYLAKRKGIGGGESSKSSSSKQGDISPEELKKIQEYYGYDKPIYVAFYQWLWVERMGMKSSSLRYTNKTVFESIVEKMPVSLIFGLTGFFVNLPHLYTAWNFKGIKRRCSI